MTSPLRLLAFSALTSAFLVTPVLASAHPVMVARADGSYQAVYSLRGRLMFVNRYSKRHLRNAVVEMDRGEVLPKEII